MMSVFEYAEDIKKSVDEVLKMCDSLDILVNGESDLLDEDAIVMLDGAFANDNQEEKENTIVDDIEEKIEEKFDIEPEEKTHKVKKKNNNNKKMGKDLAIKKKEMYKNKEKLMTNNPTTSENVILYNDSMTVSKLANLLGVPASELVKKLFMLGIMANVNNNINFETAEIIVSDYNKELKREETTDVANFEEYEVIDNECDLVKRAPVVTIMGHVDHGKTTLLDTIRKTNVALGEAGGITQAISAYQVLYNNEKITFIDTPGHAAFTEMRARGAGITDIVIIIVAADDGVMPQTKEAIDHAKAANVPIIVAINKIDKPGANVERVMTELSDYGLVPDSWGGDTLYNQISAKNNVGIDSLLENILLIADMQGYKANPKRYALGTVIESRLDKQVGPVVTLLVQNGTLRLGDPIVVGCAFGKVRTLKNDKNEEIIEALPSTPVEITGLNETPSAGDKFMSFETEKQARSVGETRKNNLKLSQNQKSTAVTLEDLFSKIKDGAKEINVIIKADVNGSSEAVKNALEKLDVEGVRVNVIRSSVGAITESDIVLARASDAIIIGFNVRPNNKLKDYAKENNVEIRLYNIIYKVVEEMEAAMKGLLDPVFEEKILGNAEIRKIFKFSRVGSIAGSYVVDGVIKSNAKARIIRDSIVIYDGSINSLQREKDAVKEVKKGLECGITIENYNDLKEGDLIEAYEIVEVKKF